MDSLFKKIQGIYGYSDYEMAVIKYVLTAIFSEISKLIILGIFYFIIGKFDLFIISFILMCLLRINCGGYHCKHYLTCLLLTFVVSYLSIVLMPNYCIPNASIMLIFLTICLFTNYYVGPVSSPFRPTPNSLLLKHCSKNGFLIIFLFILFVSIFNANSIFHIYLIVGFWTIILHTTQLIIAKIILKGEK